MATKGDLLIRTVDERRYAEWNRLKICSDAYLDGGGMKDRIIKAIQMTKEHNDIPLMNALITLDPKRYELNNSDLDGGYTYEIDTITSQIRFGYRAYSWENNSADGWVRTMSLDEFFNDGKTEKDYIQEYNNSPILPQKELDMSTIVLENKIKNKSKGIKKNI